MKNENQQIALLIAAGTFFVTLPFLMQQNIDKTRSLKTDTLIIKKSPVKAKKQKQRLPASESPYSVEDFKPKNLLNKKLMTKQEYDDALEASKHVGISYKMPNPKLDYKLTRKDMEPVRKVQEAVFIANSANSLRPDKANPVKE